MGRNNELNLVGRGSQESAIEKSLEGIARRLDGIDARLVDFIRLQERVNSHSSTLVTIEDRQQAQDKKIRGLELWQANYGDKADAEKAKQIMLDIVKKNDERIDLIESANALSQGHRDILKSILKYSVGVLVAVLIYRLTREM